MDDQNGAPAGEPMANGEDTTPVAGMISQYVKDFSFENPNSPAVYQVQGSPKIDVGFNIGTAQVGDDVHEVLLKIDVRAEAEDGTVAFVVDLTYAGLFGLRNVPEEHIQPFLLAEAPRLHPKRGEIKGTICGYRVEEIKDPVEQQARQLDKLVDELAKGKAMDKIKRS